MTTITIGDNIAIRKSSEVGKVKKIDFDIDGYLYTIKLNNGKIVQCRKGEIVKIGEPLLFLR